MPEAEASERISRAGFSQLSGGVWCRVIALRVRLSYVAVVPKRLSVMALLTWVRCSWDPKKFGQDASLMAVNERDVGAMSRAGRLLCRCSFTRRSFKTSSVGYSGYSESGMMGGLIVQ